MKKKIILGIAVIAAIAVGVVGMSAFEAHVINVTAKIENALLVPIEELDFGTVFPEEVFVQSIGVALSSSFQEQAGCSDVNLIQNGGFELPVVTHSAKWDIFPSGTAGLAWTVEWEPGQNSSYGGQTRPEPALKELHKGVMGWLPDEGDQYAELDTDWFGPDGSLNNEPALVNIYQNIATVIGRKYVLSYAYSPRPDVTNAADNTLKVRIDGGQVAIHAASGNGSQTSWTQYTYEFTANSSMTKVEFAAGGTANSLGVFLDDVSLIECGRVTSVDYVLRQKPKCVDDADPNIHPQVTHDGDEFICPEGSTMMPLLCPYLSKGEITEDGEDENDGSPIAAFHGPLTGWTMINTVEWQVDGRLSVVEEDMDDEWLIDLHVPCFRGQCAQDNVIPVEYQADPANESTIFGCDLWLEVIGINGISNEIE